MTPTGPVEPSVKVPQLPLGDGSSIPAIGLGTAPLDDDASAMAVEDALRMGYRLIDTGAIYGNEEGVGRGIAAADVPREQIALMTKLRGRDHGYAEALAAFEQSRRRLGVDYLDFYLIHWPLPRLDRYVDSWRALIKLRGDGLVRTIGVSNFTTEQIDRLERETGVRPVVDQIEVHPYFPQEQLRAALADRDVRGVCYSPLGRGGDLLGEQLLMTIAAGHGVSVAQVVLRWHTQLGLIPLPRTSSSANRRANLDVFGFELSPAEMRHISDGLPHGRTGFDPDEHEEF